MLARSRENTAELHRAEAELSRGDAEYARLRNYLAAAEADLAEVTTQLKADHATLDRERQKQLDLLQQANATQQRVESLQSQRDAAHSAAITTGQRITQSGADLAASQAEVLRRQAAVDAVTRSLALNFLSHRLFPRPLYRLCNGNSTVAGSFRVRGL